MKDVNRKGPTLNRERDFVDLLGIVVLRELALGERAKRGVQEPSVPEDVNWSQHQDANTIQHPTSTGTR